MGLPRLPRRLVQPAEGGARRVHPDDPGAGQWDRDRHVVPRNDRPGRAAERSLAVFPGDPGVAEPELQPAIVRTGGADRRANLGGPGQADVEGLPLSQQPWGGRFGEEPDRLIDRFTRSLDIDRRLFREDIAGSRAWAKALVGAGVLTAEEQPRIDQALREIESELIPPPLAGEGRVGAAEDIHMAVEKRLREKLGPLGGKLHTGRSRNDQVALDLRLYVRAIGGQLLEAITGLESALITRAEEHVDTVMPGYTHTQRAQPVLLAHHLLAYVEMLRRDRGRSEDALERANVSPLGAGALAGSGFPIDRTALARDLGFATASANSLDAVADRDFALELLAACSIAMIHLSRLCGEIVLWTSVEFSFAALPDALASGSSMMPNKKNPCAAELVRAKSGRVTGDLINLLMVLDRKST